MAIQNTTLTSSPQALINDDGERAVTVIYFYNSDPSPVTIDLHAVPSGGSASNDNKIYGNLTIEATDTYIIDTEKLLLDDGDALWGSATGNANVVVATVSYTAI